jgi:hypothetical protein
MKARLGRRKLGPKCRFVFQWITLYCSGFRESECSGAKGLRLSCPLEQATVYSNEESPQKPHTRSQERTHKNRKLTTCFRQSVRVQVSGKQLGGHGGDLGTHHCSRVTRSGRRKTTSLRAFGARAARPPGCRRCSSQ